MLTLLNSSWLFTPVVGYLDDSWYYHTNFVHFFDYVSQFPSNQYYFIERLSWNLYGYFFYHLFPPLIANYILHFSVYYVAVFALYGLLTRLFDRQAALIAALVCGSYSWFLRAVGWDYVDGFGIAQVLLVLFLLVSAAQASTPRWRVMLFLAGAFTATTINTNLFWLTFMPAVGIIFLVANAKNARHNLLISGVWFAGGLLLAALVFALFYHSWTGQFNFLANSLRAARSLANNPDNANAMRASFFSTVPLWNVLPLLLLVISALLLRKNRLALTWPYMTLAASLCFAFIPLIVWHFSSAPLLINYFYCSYLLPFIFLLIGAYAALFTRSLDRVAGHRLAFFAFAVSVLPFLLSTLFPVLLTFQQNVVLLAAACVLLLVASRAVSRPQLALSLVAVSICALSFLTDDRHTVDQVFVPDRTQAQDSFLAISDAVQQIDARFAPSDAYGTFNLWYPQEINHPTYFALAQTYLAPWGNSLFLGDLSPTLTLPADASITDGQKIVLISEQEQPTVEQALRHALAAFDADFRINGKTQIQHGNLDFYLYFLTLNLNPRTFDLNYGQNFEFDRVSGGPNWYAPVNNAGASYTWSGPGTESTLQVQLPQSNVPVQIQMCIASAIQPDTANSLQLELNEVSIPLKIVAHEGCYPYLEGVVPTTLLNSTSNRIDLRFAIDETLPAHVVSGWSGDQLLGIAYDWLRFVPKDQTPEASS